MIGERGPVIVPGSTEWLTLVTASKIAAITGRSPWESRFSLWHRMMGSAGPVDETDDMRRGHYLEPAIRAWFRDQHHGWVFGEDRGTWISSENSRFAASPDDDAKLPDGASVVCEYKTDRDGWAWGPGPDDVPDHYRPQGVWHMLCSGTRRCHYAVLDGTLAFREYVIDWDQTEADRLAAAAERFLADLDDGNRPSIDDATVTYQVIRDLHQDIDGTDIELSGDLARRYVTAKTGEKAAKAAAQHATSLIADEMGTAKRALCDGHIIATRQARGGRPPHVVTGRHLPSPDDITNDSKATSDA